MIAFTMKMYLILFKSIAGFTKESGHPGKLHLIHQGCRCRPQCQLQPSASSPGCGSASLCCPVPGSWCQTGLLPTGYWTAILSVGDKCIGTWSPVVLTWHPLFTLPEIAPTAPTAWWASGSSCCLCFSVHAQLCTIRIQSIISALESCLSNILFDGASGCNKITQGKNSQRGFARDT